MHGMTVSDSAKCTKLYTYIPEGQSPARVDDGCSRSVVFRSTAYAPQKKSREHDKINQEVIQAGLAQALCVILACFCSFDTAGRRRTAFYIHLADIQDQMLPDFPSRYSRSTWPAFGILAWGSPDTRGSTCYEIS